VGVFTPKAMPRDALRAGEVGFVIAGIKELQAAKVGDTITLAPTTPARARPCPASRKSSRRSSPACIRSSPASTTSCATRWKSCAQRRLAAFEPEVSQALGFGFRCGFLGLLHMEIVQERLEREFDQDLITTAPTVVYEVVLRDGTVIEVENPAKLPEQGKIEEIREPIITTTSSCRRTTSATSSRCATRSAACRST
jgi:GTP-binding protein LepA